MKNKWTWLIGISVIIILVAIAFTVKHLNQNSGDSDVYDTYTVKKEKPLNLEGKASPRSVKTYNNNRQIGTYLGVQVEDGQSVKQGDRLINYDIKHNKRQQLVIKLTEAQRAVNNDYQNINQQPYNKDLQKKLVQDQQALNDAQQQLNQYDNQINDSIHAAFDGKVMIQKTEHVSDGQSILQLVSGESQIKTTVSEFDLDKIKKGDHVDVTITSNGKTGKGKIKQIAELPKSYEDKLNGSENIPEPSPESDSHAEAPNASKTPVTSSPVSDNTDASKYTVIIDELDIPIRTGYSLDIKVPLNMIKIPKSVLTRDNRVFVVNKNNKVEKRTIQIERINGDIIVKKGLKVGDKLIKSPEHTMNDGDTVEVSS